MADYRQIVTDLYKQELGRDPDEAGLNYWVSSMESGASPEDVRRAISMSPEGARFDIGNIYQTQLGRAADDTGMQYWSDALTSGRMDLDNITRSFQQGEEYRKLGAEQYKDLLADTYKKELGRDIDQPGAEYWGGQLRSGAITADQLPGAFSANPEGQIFDIYADKLKRAPDAGSKYWLDKLTSGEMTLDQVRDAIAASSEGKKVAFQSSAFGSGTPGQSTTPNIYAGSAEAVKQSQELYKQQIESFRQRALENANRGPFQAAEAPAATQPGLFSFQPISTPATTPNMFQAAQPVLPPESAFNFYSTPATGIFQSAQAAQALGQNAYDTAFKTEQDALAAQQASQPAAGGVTNPAVQTAVVNPLANTSVF